MRTIAKYACCCGIALLTVTAWTQESHPSAQERLTKAKQLYTQEGPKAALPEFEETLKMFQADKDRLGEAVALGYIANCHRKLENLDKALEFAQQALHMKEGLGDRDEIGKTHNQLGLIYWERADYPGAIQHLQQAIEIASTVDDKELEGSARNNLGLVFDEQGDFKQSLEQYQRALELHRTTHFERGEGDTLGNIGGVYLLLGKFREALPYYQQALAISERLGLKPASSDDLGNIALCLAGTGDIDGALKSFDRALEVAHETGLAKEEADWHKGKGTTLVGLGRFDAAFREYAAAEQVYEHAGLKRELVEALTDTGHVYELLGDAVSAEDHFERALQLARKIGNGSGESASLLALGDLERRRKKYDSADAHFNQALEKARRAGQETTVISALLRRAMNDVDRKQYESALQSASEAKAVAEGSGNVPAVALSRYVFGELRRSQGQLQQAVEEYSAAQALQQQLRDPELGWRIYYGRGQTLAAQEKTDDAIAAYKESIRIIEQTRSGIAEERYQAGYIEDRYQVYVALVELLLKVHKPGDAFFYSEKLRARAYFDQFGGRAPAVEKPGAQQRIRELGERIQTLRRAVQKEYSVPQNERRGHALEFFSAELAEAERNYEALRDDSDISVMGSTTARRGSLPSIAEIQHLLPADAGLIEYVVGREMVSVFLVTPSSVVGIPVQIKSESLSSRTELLRGLIMERRPEWIAPARGLRKLLLDPIQSEGYLSSIRQLLIVPDGVLNYVPFAALPVGRDRFLGEEFTIAYLPAAAALVTDPRSGVGKTLLAMAPSNAQLPNSGSEVREIGRMFGSTSRVVVGKAATKTLFKQIASDYDYLHLATHGSLNRNAPSLSAIELEPDNENDGRLELYEIAGMKLNARLVALSACETALGKGYFTETPGGDEFVGITRAFLSAGGQNVLASLWAVNDESTRALMLRFYRHLLTTNGADALAKAQQEVRRSGARYRHPYYWAPFVLVGPPN
jgi:CHAT domain-containing protein/Tfp pilus assembly protein PilF